MIDPTKPLDWNAIAGVVSAWHDAHGSWLAYDDIMALQGAAALPESTPGAVPTAPVAIGYAYPAANDWDAIASLVIAHHEANGWWASLEQIEAAHWTPAPAALAPPAGTNLLYNGDFETGDSVGWNLWYGAGGLVAPLSAAGQAHAFGFGAGAQGGMSHGFGLAGAGGSLALEFDAQVGGAPAYAGLRFLDAAGHQVGDRQVTLTAGLQHHGEAAIAIPADATGAYLWFWNDAGTSLSVDNVTLAQAAPGLALATPPGLKPVAHPGLVALDHPEKMGIGIAADPWEINPASIQALGVSWYYNWTALPATNLDAVGFVPMVWGAATVSPGYLAAAARAGTVLGFNEPDSSAQSGMSVQQALDLWPQLEATGARLGSPATTNALNGWMSDFMHGADTLGLQVDFVAVHYYSDDLDVGRFKWYLETVHDTYGKAIWVTEFAPVDWGNLGKYADQQLADYLYQASHMMDDLGFVERQAWFSAYDGADNLNGWHNAAISADGSLTKVGETFAALLGH